jgi:hypothetical protein
VEGDIEGLRMFRLTFTSLIKVMLKHPSFLQCSQ